MDDKKERVLVTVDTENIYLGVLEKFGRTSRVDFSKLKRLIISNHPIAEIKAIAYIVSDLSSDSRGFIQLVGRLGFETKVEKVKGKGKSTLDIVLAVDVCSKIDEFDTWVLVGGDSDFCPLMNYLKSKGKRTEVLAVQQDLSAKYLRLADKIDFIEEGLLYEKKREPKGEFEVKEK